MTRDIEEYSPYFIFYRDLMTYPTNHRSSLNNLICRLNLRTMRKSKIILIDLCAAYYLILAAHCNELELNPGDVKLLIIIDHVD